MICNKLWRLTIISVFTAVLIGTSVVAYNMEKNSCMGVCLLTEAEEMRFTENINEELSGWISFNGEAAAVDTESKTIYIPQSLSEDMHASELEGVLTIDNPNYKLAFGYDDGFYNLSESIKNNHRFELYISRNGKEYTLYNVVFTNLPVIRMVGQYQGKNDRQKDTYTGKICVWTAMDPETDTYTTKSFSAEWHIRGDTIKKAPKRPWKLNLKKSDGSNAYENFAGLGEDDDWILNPLYHDDTNLREKSFMELWNTMAQSETHNYKMDAGEYVEVITDGVYCGVYLLQRKVDAKYLELDDSKVIFKGRKEVGENPTIENYYTAEGKYTEKSLHNAYAAIEKFKTNTDCSLLVMDNWIDINLFMQFGNQLDNSNIHNMFYIVDTEKNQITFTLWDTDFSFGVYWRPSVRQYDESLAERSICLREEYNAVKNYYPQLESAMSARWTELRKGFLSDENIKASFDSNKEVLMCAGAWQRDIEKWGYYHQGRDSMEKLDIFIEKRLGFLDKMYGYNAG